MKKKQPTLKQTRSVSNFDRVISSRVRARRLEMHMSQSDLGAKLGVTFQQIQKYERATNRIGSGRLMQIAAALNVEPGYFVGDFGSNGKDPKISPLQTFLTTKDGLDINEAMMRLQKPELRRSVIEFVRKLGTVYGQ